MKRFLSALTLAACAAVPLSALAQTPAPSPAAPGPGAIRPATPSPEQQARLQQLRADARANAFKALSADHQTAVQNIINQVTSGQLNDAQAAASQINALLTPSESAAVLAVETKWNADRRAAMAASNTAPVASSSAAPNGGATSDGAGRRPPANAGRFLLALSLTPQQMRSLMPARPAASPSP